MEFRFYLNQIATDFPWIIIGIAALIRAIRNGKLLDWLEPVGPFLFCLCIAGRTIIYGYLGPVTGRAGSDVPPGWISWLYWLYPVGMMFFAVTYVINRLREVNSSKESTL